MTSNLLYSVFVTTAGLLPVALMAIALFHDVRQLSDLVLDVPKGVERHGR